MRHGLFVGNSFRLLGTSCQLHHVSIRISGAALAEQNEKTEATAQHEKAKVLSKKNNRDQVSRVSFILQNPFYYGHFHYAGEVYEGKHEPIISKALFDKANKVLQSRSTTPTVKSDPAPYCGLLRCGFCGIAITAEVKEKHHKNGNVHRYTYYRCTGKNKAVKCKEAPMRSNPLDSQLSALIDECAMPQEWVSPFSALLEKEVADGSKTAAEAVQELRDKIADISRKLERLTDVYVAEDIEREDYLSRRCTLIGERRTIENIVRLERAPAAWVEPVRDWVKIASPLDKIAEKEDLLLKKSSLKKIFGLNLSLHAREARENSIPLYAALHAARISARKKPVDLILVPLGVAEKYPYKPHKRFRATEIAIL